MTRPIGDLSDEVAEAAKRRTEERALARAAVVEHAAGRRGVTGRVDCPVCKTGQLLYYVIPADGRILVSCSTSGCQWWSDR